MTSTPEAYWILEVMQHYEHLGRLARRLVADASLAEDLCQETIARALKQPSRPISDVRKWLDGIMHNIKCDWSRMEARWSKYEEKLAIQCKSRRDRDLTPIELVIDLYGSEAVRQASQRLHEGDRLIFKLRYVDGLKYAQIGVLLGVNERSVRTRFRRMRRRLLDMLPDEGHLCRAPQEVGQMISLFHAAFELKDAKT